MDTGVTKQTEGKGKEFKEKLSREPYRLVPIIKMKISIGYEN